MKLAERGLIARGSSTDRPPRCRARGCRPRASQTAGDGRARRRGRLRRPSRHRRERVAQARGRMRAGVARCQIASVRAPETGAAPAARPAADRAAPRGRREAAARPAARTPARHPRRLARCARQMRSAAIERLGDQPRHLGVVGQLERRVDVRFERKFAQQRQAERVDGGDGDVAKALFQLAPASGIELRQPARFFQALDDALAHFRGRLAGERDREDVIRLDARAQQVDVPLDEHARLAGSGRRFEHDVLRRIDGGGAGGPVSLSGRCPRSRRLAATRCAALRQCRRMAGAGRQTSPT